MLGRLMKLWFYSRHGCGDSSQLFATCWLLASCFLMVNCLGLPRFWPSDVTHSKKHCQRQSSNYEATFCGTCCLEPYVSISNSNGQPGTEGAICGHCRFECGN